MRSVRPPELCGGQTSLADMETSSSLVALLAKHAETQADERAYIFLGDRGAEEAVLTFRQLHDAAQGVAARLTAIARPGDRAILVFPPGLEFMVAFFGCLIARVIAVPMMMPRRQSARDASAAIMANCEPVVALTSAAFATRKDLQERPRTRRHEISWLVASARPRSLPSHDISKSDGTIRSRNIAVSPFLQITYGAI